jgi:hypothetical protein
LVDYSQQFEEGQQKLGGSRIVVISALKSRLEKILDYIFFSGNKNGTFAWIQIFGPRLKQGFIHYILPGDACLKAFRECLFALDKKAFRVGSEGFFSFL